MYTMGNRRLEDWLELHLELHLLQQASHRLDVYMYIGGSSSVRTAFFCMYRRPGRVGGAGAVNSTSFDMSRLQVRYPMPFFY